MPLPVEIRDQLLATSRVMAALKTIRIIDTMPCPAPTPPGVRVAIPHWQRSKPSPSASKRSTLEIPALLSELDCTLTEIVGVGVVTAMTLLTEIGDPTRFTHRSPVRPMVRRRARGCVLREGHGQPRRHRLDLAGNRQVNSVLHIVHVTQGGSTSQPRPSSPRAPHRQKPGASLRPQASPANVIIDACGTDAKRAHSPLDRRRLTRESFESPELPLPAAVTPGPLPPSTRSRSLLGDPGHGPQRHRSGTMDHALKPALNAFAVTFADRMPAAETSNNERPETPFIGQPPPTKTSSLSGLHTSRCCSGSIASPKRNGRHSTASVAVPGRAEPGLPRQRERSRLRPPTHTATGSD